MPQTTAEDCLKQVPNRFELVILAANRSREIYKGATPLVETKGLKPAAIALEEIAAGKLNEKHKKMFNVK